MAWAPGAFELPLVARRAGRPAASYDAVIGLGAVIRGATGHYDMVAGQCAAGIQRAQLDTGVPVVFGVLTTDTIEQAIERAGTKAGNKGVEAADDRHRDGRPAAPAAQASLSDPGAFRYRSRAAPRAAEGLARAGDPRAVRGGRPGRPPQLATWTTGRPSTIPGSPRSGSCGPRRSPATSPRACSTWASPGGTGSRRRRATVVSLGELHYSKATARPIRVVLAVADDSPVPVGRRPPRRGAGGDRVPGADRPLSWPSHGVEADVLLSYGATEAKIPEIADAVVEITETGRALRAAGLRIIETILVSYTELIANPAAYAGPRQAPRHGADPHPAAGTLEARGRVLVKLNVAEADLDGVIALLPAHEVADGVEAVRRGRLRGRDGGPEADINTLIPALKDRGATGHHRAADRQDRPLRPVAGAASGRVDFDAAGLGVVRGDDGTAYPFHCTQIADGSRTIAVGTWCGLRWSPATWAVGGGGHRAVLPETVRILWPVHVACARTGDGHGRDWGRRRRRLVQPPGPSASSGPAPPSASAGRPAGRADLDERQPQLGRGPSMSWGSWSPSRPAMPSTRAPRASMASRAWSRCGRLLGEVEGGQLEQAEGVVGHDHLGRRPGQLLLQLVELGRPLLGRSARRRRPTRPGSRPRPRTPAAG